MSKKVFILVELPIEQAVALESIVGDVPYHEYIEKLVQEHISAQHRLQRTATPESAGTAPELPPGLTDFTNLLAAAKPNRWADCSTERR